MLCVNYIAIDINLSSNSEKNTRKKHISPFNPEFTIVIFIHYKPRIAAAILDL